MDGKLIATETQQIACVYQISPTSTSIGSGGGSGTVTVTATAGCAWTAASNDPSWITVTSGGSGNGNGTVGYSVASNSGPLRSGTITIAGQTFSITQASGCSYSISPTSGSFGPGGGSGSFNVYSGGGCTWSATNNGYSWITITSGASGSGNGTVAYSVASNNMGDRWGYPNIAGQVPTVYQSSYQQPTCFYFGASSGFAGIDTMAMTACNGANMMVDLFYNYQPWGPNGWYPTYGTIGPTDGSGHAYLFLTHDAAPGTGVFNSEKNQLRADWNTISPPAQYAVRPAKPTYMTVYPSTVQLPAWITLTVGNGQDQTMRVWCTPPDNNPWDTTFPVDAAGQYSVYMDCGQAAGTYTFTAIRNDLDSGGGATTNINVPLTTLACH